MNLKKQIKKTISYFIPKSDKKEKAKLFYYNLFSKKDISFQIIFNSQKTYITNYKNLVFKTLNPLYSIVPDFEYYQYFYKVKEGDVVIDAGANEGYLSFLFSKLVKKTGIVYAFEPDSINVKTIFENISLDSFLDKNIIIQELLLWNENKLVNFYESGGVGSSAVWIPDKDKLVKKQAVTIDDWVFRNNIEKLDFIKMDIEGAEIEALEGCLETIIKLKPNFAIAAYHIVNGEPTYIKVEQFFKDLDYPCKTVTFRKNEIITFAGTYI